MTKKLTYVLSTLNKLSFLEVTFPILINALNEDEELIVVDGGSNDGTVEYLNKACMGVKNIRFITEEDKGEAHAFNKGLMLAEGELIKIISDDDAQNFKSIQKCREYMLENPGIDIMGGNTANIIMDDIHSLYCSFAFQEDYRLWQEGQMKNFFFNGTCLMLRKSSIPLTGLFNTSCLLADLEFTLRVTGVAKIAWCTGIIATRILNSCSNNYRYTERAQTEDEKLCDFYDYRHSHIRVLESAKKRSIHKKIRSFLGSFYIRKLENTSAKNSVDANQIVTSFKEIHDHCDRWMKNHEQNREIKFLTCDQF